MTQAIGDGAKGAARRQAREDAAGKPWVDNYPPLKAWLAKHEARCNWQIPLGSKDNPGAYVESWVVRGGGEVLVVVYGNQNGWNLFTPERSGKIAETFADAEKRMGIVVPGAT